MLQQTTVGAVLPRYARFLERFPNLPALARARESSVLAAWSGLGYYARARNLRAAARRILAEHGGVVPRDPEDLAALPGFGEYMAAAVASIAYGARVPAVDANVTRVASRLFAIEGVAGTRSHAAAVRSAAAALLPARRPGDLTAALMDLGQRVCLPRKPDCPACALAHLCAARASGMPERYPQRRAKVRPIPVHHAAAVARVRGRTLLVQADGPLLSRLWLFPWADGASAASARTRLARALARLGFALASPTPIGSARHTMVNRRLDIRVYRAVLRGPAFRDSHDPARARWWTPAELARAAIPTLTRKVAAAAGGADLYREARAER